MASQLSNTYASDPEPSHDHIGRESAYIGKQAHVYELPDGPHPCAGFALHYSQCRHTLQGECEEDQQRAGARWSEIRMNGVAQPRRGLAFALHSINRAKRSYDHFACGQRGNQSDAHLPVEAEWL